MTHRRSIYLASALALPLVAVAIAGCGGSSDNANASPSNTKAFDSARTATVNVRSTSLGKILVDSQGRTLYLFEKDTGPKSTCSGACTSAWPPFRTEFEIEASTGCHAD
jgi:predicted lipoprotein with Yx(FWY)xxD motif